MKYIYQSIVLVLILSIIVGVIYPVCIYIVTQFTFNKQANGSIIYNQNNQPIASELIGQQFTESKYFWSRPSATENYPYNALASGGSNLGALNPQLEKNVAQYSQKYTESNQVIPVDLVTSSGSGLDPEISIAAAYYQMSRIAKARNITENQLKQIIDENAKHPIFNLIGENRVNVINLNLLLDRLQGN